MARIRTVKPEHWSDKELVNISLQAHLLWIATWNFSDDEGIFENDPVLIKSNVFPRRTDVRVEQVSQWLDQLVKARFIVPFNFKNEGYYMHRTFKAHQRIDKPQASKIPESLRKSVFQEHSKNDPRTVGSVKESIGEDSKVKGEYRRFAHLSITNESFESLKELGFTKKEIDDILDSIENYKANIKYKSLFMTAKKWLEKDKEKNSAKKENGNGQQIGTKAGQQHPLQNLNDLSNGLLQGFASQDS